MQDQSLDLDNGDGLGIFKNPSQSGFKNDNGLAIVKIHLNLVLKNDNGLAIVNPIQLTFLDLNFSIDPENLNYLNSFMASMSNYLHPLPPKL